MSRQELSDAAKSAPSTGKAKAAKATDKSAKIKIIIAAVLGLAALVLFYVQFLSGPAEDAPLDPKVQAQADEINKATDDHMPPPPEGVVREPVSRKPIKRGP